MATPLKKGKLLLSLLLIFSSDSSIFFPRFSCAVHASAPDPSPIPNPVIGKDTDNENLFQENPYVSLLKKQQLHLDKIQELVQNLTRLVSRLESQCPSKEDNSPEKTEEEEVNLSSKNEIFTAEEEGETDKSVGAVSKYSTLWSEKFHFVSAVKLKSTPTCVDVLPYRDQEGSSKYFAVGVENGSLFVFLKSGDVSLEIVAGLSSPVTAVVSAISVFKNETVVATGHENGVVVIHRVWEMLTGDDWNPLRVERLGRFENSDGPQVDMLEVHHVGRKRYILATDGVGKIRVLGEDGSLHGSVNPGRRPVAFLKQRLLFFTETGAGSLDLRTMRLKETECEGLNNSFVRSYVFDAVDRTKAYGLTSEGDLVHTIMLGDARNFKCWVRFKRRLDLDRPVVAMQSIRGYLLIANKEKVFVYNVSSQHYVRPSGPRLLFSAGFDEITASFLNPQQTSVDSNDEGKIELLAPLIGSDHERTVLVRLVNGYVVMYRSDLPVFNNSLNSILWSSPVLFFIIFLFATWYFFANKKHALTSWGPDDPFSASVTSGDPPSGSAVGERSVLDSALRNSENMDQRGSSGLRGSSRYISPPRYAGGNPYRPGNDEDPTRTGAVDPRYRAELKYRGQHVEGAARRETVFVNGQVVDDTR